MQIMKFSGGALCLMLLNVALADTDNHVIDNNLPVKKWMPALLTKVVGLSKGDVLNLRNKPDHQSKKVGEVLSEYQVGIDFCIKKSRSVWCKIHSLSPWQAFNENENIVAGWVNAKYISLEYKTNNRSYVLATNEPANCLYSLACQNFEGKQQCLVVEGYDFEMKENGISKPNAKWINREMLKAVSAINASPENADGFCNNGKMLDDYLQNNPAFIDYFDRLKNDLKK
ncbi:MAG: SH3 domain-containing protein [Colwellia sp.]